MLKSLKQDILYALRMIVKTPVVTMIAVVSLAIGVAANTTVFSTVHSWLLRPLPYPDADRLVMVWHNDLLEEGDERLVTPADYFDWTEQATSLEDWMAWTYTTVNLTGIERPVQLTAASVTPNYFFLLEVSPKLGRAFQPDEGGAEDTPVALMSETLWATRFGSDPGTVGSTVTLDGDRYTILGIIPETFDFLPCLLAAIFEGQQFQQGFLDDQLLQREIGVSELRRNFHERLGDQQRQWYAPSL